VSARVEDGLYYYIEASARRFFVVIELYCIVRFLGAVGLDGCIKTLLIYHDTINVKSIPTLNTRQEWHHV
jgi:hypothetical protein